jgi:hypothetical protein
VSISSYEKWKIRTESISSYEKWKRHTESISSKENGRGVQSTEDEGGVQSFKELKNVSMQSFKENARSVQGPLAPKRRKSCKESISSREWKRRTEFISSKENGRGSQSLLVL